MSEMYRRRLQPPPPPPSPPTIQILTFHLLGMIAAPLQKPETSRENRNQPLSAPIERSREHLRFRVFMSRQNLGRSGNSKIPDRLRFPDI